MNYDRAYTNVPLQSIPISLRNIFFVHADKSYNIDKNENTPNNIYIALRTFEGEGKMKLDKEEIILLPGTLAIFELNKIKNYYCTNEKWNFYWFEFSTDNIIEYPTNQLIHINPFDKELEECSQCIELLDSKKSGMARLASSVFSMLLCKWMIQIERYNNNNRYYVIIKNSIEHIRKNLHKRISISELAHSAGFCERRYREIFKQITGQQPKRYIETLKINAAEQFLAATPLTILEISIKLGYSSQFHFCKAFRHINNIPPSNYRNNIMNQNKLI